MQWPSDGQLFFSFYTDIADTFGDSVSHHNMNLWMLEIRHLVLYTITWNTYTLEKLYVQKFNKCMNNLVSKIALF